MTWDVATARKRIGLEPTDTTRDEDLQACMDAALAFAEKYCDRQFLFKEGVVVRVLNVTSPDLHVYRWPIKTITTVQSPQADGSLFDLAYAVDKDLGVIYLGGTSGAWRTCSRDVVITYDGGFDPLPPDLEWALWVVFDQLWSTSPGWGTTSSVSADTGAVRSFSVDGMSIGYDTTGAASGGGGAGGAPGAWGVLPARVVACLEFYRAETAVGGA